MPNGFMELSPKTALKCACAPPSAVSPRLSKCGPGERTTKRKPGGEWALGRAHFFPLTTVYLPESPKPSIHKKTFSQIESDDSSDFHRALLLTPTWEGSFCRTSGADLRSL